MVQSDVVELCILDDGRRAGVVSRVHESEDLGGCWNPPFRLVQRRQRLVSRRELSDRDQLQEVPEIFLIKAGGCGGLLKIAQCVFISSRKYRLCNK